MLTNAALSSGPSDAVQAQTALSAPQCCCANVTNTLTGAALAGAPMGSGRGDGVQLGQRGLLLAAAAQLPPPAARAT